MSAKKTGEHSPRQAGATIRKRVRELQESRGARQEASATAEERAALEKELAAAQAEGATRQQKRALERAHEKLEARALRLLQRDDETVRAVLQEKGKLSGVMSAAGPADADEFLRDSSCGS